MRSSDRVGDGAGFEAGGAIRAGVPEGPAGRASSDRAGGVRLAALAALVGAAIGCGGGSSGGGGQGGTAVAGVAAVGAPLAGASVEVKDRAGNTATSTTGADGGYTVDLAALDAVFLVQVTLAAPPTELYSVGTQGGGVVNLTPLTDLAIRAYYDALGLDVATVFAGLDATSAIPSPGEVQALAGALRALVAPLLEERGLTADEALAFDIFSTPFAADGTGYDGLLDDTTVTGTGYTVTGGTIDQTVTLTGSGGAIDVAATTTGPGGSSTASTSIGVTAPADQDALEAARAGSLATLQQLFAVVAQRGPALADADVRPFFVDAADYLDGGRNLTQSIAQLVAEVGGLDLAFLGIERVLAFDPAGSGAAATGDVITVAIRVRETVGGQSAESVDEGSDEETVTYAFRREASGAYRLFGNQRILSTDVGNLFQLVHDAGNVATPTGTQRFTVFATAPPGAVTSVDATFTVVGSASQTVTLVKGSASGAFGAIDAFSLPGGPQLAGALAAGSTVRFDVTPATGSPATITRVVGSAIQETLRITHVQTGNGPTRTLADFYANETVASTRGQRVTVTFQRPQTFGLAENRPFGTLNGASGAFDFIDATIRSLPTTATTASFDVPSTTSGQTVVGYGLVLDFADLSANAVQLALNVGP